MSIPLPSKVAPLPPLPGPGPAWYRVALYQMSLWDARARSHPGQKMNLEAHVDWDQAYFDACPMFGGRVHDIGSSRPRGNIDWCSAFVNYCLHRAGCSHTGNAYARSFLDNSLWHFKALAEPQVGCVAVVGLPRGAHVGFIASTKNLEPTASDNVVPSGNGFELLGGNQGQRISIKVEPRALVAARDKLGSRSPYLWPLSMGMNCNIGIDTARPHSCGNPHRG